MILPSRRRTDIMKILKACISPNNLPQPRRVLSLVGEECCHAYEALWVLLQPGLADGPVVVETVSGFTNYKNMTIFM